MNARATCIGAGRVLGLFLLALLFVASFHHRVFLGPQTFALSGTLGSHPAEHGVRRVVHDPYASSGQFEPWLDHQRREEERGSGAPRWNPWQGLGAPFLANAQTAVYHPVRWLQTLVSPRRAFDLAVLVHLATAALGMWLLLGVFGLERIPRALGAVAFACSGYLVFFANMVHLGAEALMPWHVLAIELVWRGRRLAGASLCCGSFALSHYAGFPESTALCALLALAWLLARVLNALGRRAALLWLGAGALAIGAAWIYGGAADPNTARIARGNATALAAALFLAALCCAPRVARARCVTLGLALLAGTLLAAPVLLPFLEFLSRAQHLHAAERWVGSTSFPADTWIGLVFPNLTRFGAGMNGGYEYGEPPYLGALVVGLGLLAPWLAASAHPARKPALLFAALAALGTAKLFALPGTQWIGDLPPLREIILRKYLGLPVAFAWAGCAACGLAALRSSRGAQLTFTALALGAAAFYSATTLEKGWSVSDPRWLRSTPLLVCAGSLTVAAAIWISARRRILVACSALLALGAAAELYLHVPRKRAARTLAYATPKGLVPWIDRLRGERIVAANGVLPPNIATRYAIQDLRFLDAMVEKGLYRYLDARFDLELRDRWDGPTAAEGLPDLEELDHLGVRWFLAPREWLPRLQERRIDLAVAAEGAGAMRVASGAERGLHLVPGAKVFAGPFQVPREGPVRAVFSGALVGPPPVLEVHRLGAEVVAFESPAIPLDELRERYGRAPALERAPIGFGRDQGRLSRELFAEKPVLASFLLDLDSRPLTSARLDVTEVRWNGGPLPPGAFRAAQRLSADLVPDEKSQRSSQDHAAPNRLWLEPSADPAFGAHVFVDYRFAPQVPASSALRLRIEAQPVLGTAPPPLWTINSEGLALDLDALRGETLYLELTLGASSHLRLEEALLEGASPRFQIHQREPIVVAENLRALPTAYLAHRVRVVGEDELEVRLREETFDPRAEAWVSGEHARALDDRDTLPERGVRVHRPRADTLVLSFEARGPLLVVLEPFDPNWKVRIDGRPAPLVPVFGAFRGVYVDDGDQRVVMQYRPDSWMVGQVIASATAGVLLLYLLGLAHRRARSA